MLFEHRIDNSGGKVSSHPLYPRVTWQWLTSYSLITTGTPGGVALGMKPLKYLKDGDEVVEELKGVGKVRNVMNLE